VLFILWCGLVTAADAVGLKNGGEEVSDWMQQHSFFQIMVLAVMMYPLFEELLFRGALFSALFHEWGLKVAVAVPSVIWALAHIQYEAWYMVSIAGAGVVLAMIRWRSGSLYLPLALHAAFNLFVALAKSPGP
jgi:membrane protease YdiL (CAAX protease family)